MVEAIQMEPDYFWLLLDSVLAIVARNGIQMDKSENDQLFILSEMFLSDIFTNLILIWMK